MADPTPSGLISVPTVALARLVASAPTFQDLVDSDEVGALDSIHYEEVDDSPTDLSDPAGGDVEIANPPPRAIIYWPLGWSTMREGPGVWRDPGMLELAFELPIPDEFLKANTGSYRSEFLYVANTVGAIIDEMRDNSGGDDGDGNPLLNANRFEFTHPPMPCDQSREYLYFWGCELRVHWP
jgi:hypothetical protein